jgi:transcriptional regulator with XRE-family HTH domain
MEEAWSVDTSVLDKARVLHGWTPPQLARAAHMDPRTVRRLLARRQRPTIGTVQALCDALGLRLVDVMVFRTARPETKSLANPAGS